jgi:UDP-N-acetylmuramyl pentapeptide phosphotransferase/UDP-N-acetylglucosamine-1-phosphate transferase
MNTIYEHLELLLRAAAVTQLAVAILNLSLIRIMNWQPDLERMPLLIREVFHIHVQFISITLAIFGVLTWVCADEITAAATPLAVGFAFSIATFWGIRSAMQWLHYSPEHRRGNPGRTAIHWALFLGYGALSAVYLIAAGRSLA